MSRKDFQDNWNEITGLIHQNKSEKSNFLNKNLKRTSEFFCRDIDCSDGDIKTILHSEYQLYKEEKNLNFEL